MFFCLHKWEVITDKTIPNSITRLGGHIKGVYPDDLKDTYILVIKCSECGKLDKTVEKV